MWVMRVVIIGFAVMALLFMGGGATMVWRQTNAVSGYLPAEATIISRSSEQRSTSRRRFAVVEYRYFVNGQAHVSKNVWAPDEFDSVGQSRSLRRVNQLRLGQTVTAYYDQRRPEQAYLFRDVSFFPYAFILGPMVHLCVAVGLAISSGMTRLPRAQAPVAIAQGWCALAVHQSTGRKLLVWMVIALIWLGIGSAALAHYFHFADGPYPTFTKICVGVYGVISLVPLTMCGYFLLLLRRGSDAQVLVKQSSFSPGEAIEARVIYTQGKSTLLNQLKIGLLCDAHIIHRTQGGASYTTQIARQQWHTLTTKQQVEPDQALDFEQSLTIPADAHPTTTDGTYPAYVWKLTIRADLHNCPDYAADFIIDVLPTGQKKIG
jgi:hypothetical protein